MNRIYHEYHFWEDYKNGMYLIDKKPCEKKIDFCIELLSDVKIFLYTGRKMILSWPIASEENLTNKSINRKAWIGQATCNFNHGATETETKIAWGKIPDKIKIQANQVAEKIIIEYEAKNKSIHKNLGIQLL